MIRGKGKLIKVAGNTVVDEFYRACEKLPDNDNYLFVICDDTKIGTYLIYPIFFP